MALSVKPIKMPSAVIGKCERRNAGEKYQAPHEIVELSKTLKAVRLSKGIRQHKLAESLGYERTSLANLEAGRQRVSFDTLINWAGALGYDLKLEMVKREQKK